jgi:hypothetical protein
MTDERAIDTTAEQDRATFGQRRINLIWEGTQAAIAVSVTLATVSGALMSVESAVLSNSFFLVVGFYFGRTNHQRIGGVVQGR